MSKSYTLNRDAIFFFFGVGRVKVKFLLILKVTLILFAQYLQAIEVA